MLVFKASWTTSYVFILKWVISACAFLFFLIWDEEEYTWKGGVVSMADVNETSKMEWEAKVREVTAPKWLLRSFRVTSSQQPLGL